MSAHILKMTKFQDKERIFKAAREKQKVTYKGAPVDMDPGQWDPCVMAAIDKLTRTTEILRRKRDGMTTL